MVHGARDGMARGGLALYRRGQVLHSLLSPTPHCCRSAMRNRRCSCALITVRRYTLRRAAVAASQAPPLRASTCGRLQDCDPVAAVSFGGTPSASVDGEVRLVLGAVLLDSRMRKRVDRQRPASSQTPLAASGTPHQDMAKPGFSASTLPKPDPSRWNPVRAASTSG
jgi:hypothetical protein